MNLQILFSYFKNIWKVLSFDGIKNTIISDFNKPKFFKILNAIKYILIIPYACIFYLAIIFDVLKGSEKAIFSMFIGIFSVIPLIIGFFKVLWRSIKSLFTLPNESQNEPPFQDTTHQNLLEEVSNDENTNFTIYNNKKDETESEQSLIDPCGIMNQIEYFNFIDDPEVNHFASFFRKRKFNIKMIPGIIVFFISITYITLEIIRFIRVSAFILLFFSFIIVINFISIPFLMIFNPIGIFMDSKRTKEKYKSIRIMWIVVLIGYLLLILIGLIFVVACNAMFSTQIPHNLVGSVWFAISIFQ